MRPRGLRYGRFGFLVSMHWSALLPSGFIFNRVFRIGTEYSQVVLLPLITVVLEWHYLKFLRVPHTHLYSVNRFMLFSFFTL